MDSSHTNVLNDFLQHNFYQSLQRHEQENNGFISITKS